MKTYSDYLLTAYSPSQNVLVYYTSTLHTVSKAGIQHKLSNVSKAVLAQAINAATLLSGNLKNSNDSLSMMWHCGGPSETVYAEINHEGHVRGFINNTKLQNNSEGTEFSTGPYIQTGELVVKRNSFAAGTPYSSVVELQTGDISQDVAYYLDQSLQMQSYIELKILISNESEVTFSGGIMILGLPGCLDSEIIEMYNKWQLCGGLTGLKAGDSESVVEILTSIGFSGFNKKNIDFLCGCNEGKIINMLKKIDSTSLSEFKNENNQYSISCQFCGNEYVIDQDKVEL